MAKILLKKVPPKTNSVKQKKVMREWSAVIVERYSSGQNIPIVAAGECRSSDGYITVRTSKKKK